MKKMWLLAILLGVSPDSGLAQTTEELVNDGKNTENVITQSMGTTERVTVRSSKSTGPTSIGYCPSGTRVS